MPKKLITQSQEKEVKRLYLKGLTGKEISLMSGLSLKQIYSSLKRQDVPRKTLQEQNKILYEKKIPTFILKNNLSVKEKKLMIAGLMLYYGEGAKTGVTVDLANSDELVIKLFLKFLRQIFQVEEKKLRFYLYCFSNQNPNSLINYWSFVLQVNKKQFTKPYIRVASSRNNRVMSKGLLHVRYGDKKLLIKILELCKKLFSSL